MKVLFLFIRTLMLIWFSNIEHQQSNSSSATDSLEIEFKKNDFIQIGEVSETGSVRTCISDDTITINLNNVT